MPAELHVAALAPALITMAEVTPKSALARFPELVFTARIPSIVPSLPGPVPIFSPVEVTPAGYVAAESVAPTV